MTRRAWAIIMLAVFLLGVFCAVYSLIVGNNELGLIALSFILLSAIAAWIIGKGQRADIAQEEALRQEEREKQEKQSANQESGD